MEFLKSFQELIPKFDGFILDLWGVTHDGVRPFPGVLETLASLKEKHVVFLSNAPRRAWTVIEKLEEMGIGRHLYHDIVTSGEDVYDHLKNRPDAFYQSLGNRLYHLGPKKDTSLMESLSYEVVSSLEDADFILNSGVVHDYEDVDTFRPLLNKARECHLPMICANPDKVVISRGNILVCAGAIAKAYEDMGGFVHYHGKPYKGVYNRILNSSLKWIAVGDSFETDLQGAKTMDIASAFVPGGIHTNDLKCPYGSLPKEEYMEKLAKDFGIFPTYVVPGLC